MAWLATREIGRPNLYKDLVEFIKNIYKPKKYNSISRLIFKELSRKVTKARVLKKNKEAIIPIEGDRFMTINRDTPPPPTTKDLKASKAQGKGKRKFTS